MPNNHTPKNPIILALDLPTTQQAHTLIQQTKHQIGAYKIGHQLFTAAGPPIIQHIRQQNIPIFLDLKLHDIPNTVAHAVTAATHHDIQLLTIHAQGGLTMMQAAQNAAQQTATKLNKPPPLLLAVTILTSLNTPDLHTLGIPDTIPNQTQRLVQLALKAGITGFICSPHEIQTIRQTTPPNTTIITPGIRPPNQPQTDQKRTTTPKQALQAGANYLVIGRPIHAAPNPTQALQQILKSIQ